MVGSVLSVTNTLVNVTAPAELGVPLNESVLPPLLVAHRVPFPKL